RGHLCFVKRGHFGFGLTHQRREVLVRIFGEASALFTVACHVYEFEKESSQKATFGAEGLDALKGVVVERFRKAARDRSLQSAPFLEFVLSRYAEWAEEEEVEEYVSELVQTDQGLCDCFAGLVYEGAIARSHIERFLPRDRDFVVRSRSILDGEAPWLTQRHCMALEAYLQQVEHPSA
ncbi:MAG: hypothetical protein OXK20_09455, partial [Deltaproteobacteria bacterium]|nr:hypothetical protein [Deltaproteobacteria bacterium]